MEGGNGQQAQHHWWLKAIEHIRHFWNAFLEVAEVVGSLEGNDGSDFESTDAKSNRRISSTAPQSKPEQTCTPDREHSGAAALVEAQHPEVIQHAQSKDSNVKEASISSISELNLINDTELTVWADPHNEPLYLRPLSQAVDGRYMVASNRGSRHHVYSFLYFRSCHTVLLAVGIPKHENIDILKLQDSTAMKWLLAFRQWQWRRGEYVRDFAAWVLRAWTALGVESAARSCYRGTGFLKRPFA